MTESFFDKDILIEHARRLSKKGFKPGFDNMTAKTLVIWLEINGGDLIKDIRRRRYKPMPAIGFNTVKKAGSCRQTACLTALDTVIQQALLDSFSEYAEERFSDSSYAHRKERGLSAAVQQYCSNGNKYAFAAKYVPVSIFDNIDHKILKEAVSLFINDNAVISLIMKYAETPVIINGEPHSRKKGLLPGAPLSPLLCDMYMHSLDMFLEDQGIPFIRYAENVVMFADTLEDITRISGEAEAFARERLKLHKNPAKSEVGAPCDLTYLGFGFERDRNGNPVAHEAGAPVESSYRSWHESNPGKESRRVDILSDGILRQKDFSLQFESGGIQTDIPIMNTDVINIYSSVVFDTGFLSRVSDSGIIVNVFSRNGALLGQYTPNSPLKSPRVTIKQLEEYNSEKKRLWFASQFVLASIHNLRLVIRYYNKAYPDPLYDKKLESIDNTEKRIKSVATYENLLLLEAQARQDYYDCFDSFIRTEGFVFGKRSRRPPLNEVNAMLSFGNTVLYNLIATEIYKTPLDVRIGYLHATNSRPQSLNLDIAEIFKPLVVDRVVFTLINRRVISPDEFVTGGNGVYLNEEGKRIFLKAFYDKLDTSVTVKDRSVSYICIIKEELRKLVRHFRHGEKYKPFKQIR